uniref:Uncharacterized protein n=1 Tax=Fagus sylvatica TaxID=28930 RepID=A0A2N9IQB1_FAGSY
MTAKTMKDRAETHERRRRNPQRAATAKASRDPQRAAEKKPTRGGDGEGEQRPTKGDGEETHKGRRRFPPSLWVSLPLRGLKCASSLAMSWVSVWFLRFVEGLSCFGSGFVE